MSKDRLVVVAVVLAACVGLYVGWQAFWFLCDDAYIAFRYVSNRQLGHGYVWNAPPFRPVEGYTSFLWVVLLDGIWSLVGKEPPDAANVVSLGFSYGSLGVIVAMALRMPLSTRFERWRPAILALVLISTLTNRTFLAWTSSGLETAMVTFLVLTWTYLAVIEHRATASAPGLAALSLLAGLGSLARPDGLLYVAATGAIWALRVRGGARPAVVAAGLPLLIPVAHLAWRLSFYGYPLPNTYYAKHVGAWPLSGVIYLGSFLLEYAYFVWLGVVIGAVVALVRRIRRDGVGTVLADAGSPVPWIGVATVVAHWAYYTFLVGGDHFEYRVYHHLVPLVPLSLVWLLDRLGVTWRRTAIAGVAMLLLGWPLPWVHWWHTHTTTVIKQKGMPHYEIAGHFPYVVRWYPMAWDGIQGWMIGHFVGLRHQSHKIYCMSHQYGRFPSREEGLAISGEGLPVLPHSSVGYPAWTMPNVAIIDKLGLSDVVIARNPSKRVGQTRRKMAHDRSPPKGYVECYRPNVKVDAKGRVTVAEREEPLTPEDVVRCETEWLAKVEGLHP